MGSQTGVDAIAHVIGLSVAPVFLLSGVSAMLGVLSNRVARIIDRARMLEGRVPDASPARQAALHDEIRVLAVRARLMYRAITLCTVCALLICGVVISLFLGAFFRVDVSNVIGVLFIAGLTSLGLGLATFLREMNMATRNLRIGVQLTERD